MTTTETTTLSATRTPMFKDIHTPVFKSEWILSFTYSAVAVAMFLGVWEVTIKLLNVPLWLIPKPSDFLARLLTDYAMITKHAWVTTMTIVMGFALGVIIAVPLGLAVVSIQTLERGLYPVIVFLNIIPKTVIGPILIIWFGIGPLVSVIIVFLMCFFPVLVDSMSGFRAVDPRLYYITHSMGASNLQTFRYVRLPASMIYIFAGMKIGIMKAVEGVIIAEFIASSEGLGYMIMRASSFMDMTLMFSGLIAAATVALVFNGAMMAAERLLMPWARHHHV